MKKLYVKNEGGNEHSIHTETKIRFKYSRHSKKLSNNKVSHIPIKNNKTSRKIDGYDFRPLFKYLLKQEGKEWNKVWEDIFPRVDGMWEPISFMVQNITKSGTIDNTKFDLSTAHPVFRYGRYDGNRLWSSMYVDDDGILRYVNKNYTPKIIYGEKWGQSFNGKHTKFNKQK